MMSTDCGITREITHWLMESASFQRILTIPGCRAIISTDCASLILMASTPIGAFVMSYAGS